jgi:hypothetical protein
MASRELFQKVKIATAGRRKRRAVPASCGSLCLIWAAFFRQSFVLTGDYCFLIVTEEWTPTARMEYYSKEQLSYFCPSLLLRCALNCTVKCLMSPPPVIKKQVPVTEASLSR